MQPKTLTLRLTDTTIFIGSHPLPTSDITQGVQRLIHQYQRHLRSTGISKALITINDERDGSTYTLPVTPDTTVNWHPNRSSTQDDSAMAGEPTPLPGEPVDYTPTPMELQSHTLPLRRPTRKEWQTIVSTLPQRLRRGWLHTETHPASYTPPPALLAPHAGKPERVRKPLPRWVKWVAFGAAGAVIAAILIVALLPKGYVAVCVDTRTGTRAPSMQGCSMDTGDYETQYYRTGQTVPGVYEPATGGSLTLPEGAVADDSFSDEGGKVPRP